MNDPIQGVTATTQEAPTTVDEINDVMTGLSAGVNISDLMEPKPDPTREYTAFLSDIWDVHFQADFMYNTSGLLFDSWIPNGTGSLQGQSEAGVPFTANILFSVNAPLDDRIGITPDDLAILEAVDASFGPAWLELSTETTSTKLFGIWLELTDVENITHAAFVPITTISSGDWNNLQIALPSLLEDIEFFWGDFMYREGGPWGSFRNAMGTAARAGGLALGVVAVVAVVGVAAPAIAAAAGVTLGASTIAAIAGTTAVVATSVVVANEFANATDQNIQDLRDQLQDDLDSLPNGLGDNIDLDSMTDAEIVAWIIEMQ